MKRLLATLGLAASLATPTQAQQAGMTIGLQRSQLLQEQVLVGAGLRWGPFDLDVQAAPYGRNTRYGSADLPIVIGDQRIGTLTVPTRTEYEAVLAQAQLTARIGAVSAGPLFGVGELETRTYWRREPDREDVRIGGDEERFTYWGGVLGLESGPIQLRFSVAQPHLDTRLDHTLYGLAVSIGR